MNTAQTKLEQELRQLEVSAVFKNKPYEMEIIGLFSEKGSLQNATISNKEVAHVEVSAQNLIARVIGLSDTFAKRANADINKYPILINPYVIEIGDSLLAPEYKVSEKLVPEILGILSRQKDILDLSILKKKSTDKGNLPFDATTFKNDIATKRLAQSGLLGINQKKTVIIMSENIKIELEKVMVGTTNFNYWDDFYNWLATNQIAYKITTLEDNLVLIGEEKFIVEYNGEDPSLIESWVDGHGNLRKNMHQFSFSNNDYVVNKAEALQKFTTTGLKVVVNGLLTEKLKEKKATTGAKAVVDDPLEEPTQEPTQGK